VVNIIFELMRYISSSHEIVTSYLANHEESRWDEVGEVMVVNISFRLIR